MKCPKCGCERVLRQEQEQKPEPDNRRFSSLILACGFRFWKEEDAEEPIWCEGSYSACSSPKPTREIWRGPEDPEVQKLRREVSALSAYKQNAHETFRRLTEDAAKWRHQSRSDKRFIGKLKAKLGDVRKARDEWERLHPFIASGQSLKDATQFQLSMAVGWMQNKMCELISLPMVEDGVNKYIGEPIVGEFTSDKMFPKQLTIDALIRERDALRKKLDRITNVIGEAK